MTSRSRRDFLKMAGIAAAAGSVPFSLAMPRDELRKGARKPVPFDLGIASYTFRKFTLEEAIAMTKRAAIGKLALKDVHLPLTSSPQEIAAALAKMKSAGVAMSSCGVVYMKTEAEVARAFAYARSAGLNMMVGAPDMSMLGATESAVKATGIALAIHNHGPNDERFPSPESAYRAVEKMDKRMGLCIDVGHTQRLGLDPAAEAERFFDRLLDMHLKDVSSADAQGSTVEIGRGVIDVPKLLRTLIRLKYTGTLHIEHEKDENDPLPGVAESAGYLRGVLDTLSTV